MNLFSILRSPFTRNLLDIALLSVGFYYLLLLLRGTRAMHALKGLVLFGVIYYAAETWGLRVVHSLLSRLATVFLIIVVIVFQPEIRRALARLGQTGFFGRMLPTGKSYVDEIVKACSTLSKRKVGALIGVTREASLQNIIETGTPVDSMVRAEILTTIFTPYTPLHDGAVIIRDGRLAAASCMLPLSEKIDLDKDLGTRHRAAIGLTEESDAVVVVVSEETGIISVAVGGRLTRNHDRESLSRLLNQLLRLEASL